MKLRSIALSARRRVLPESDYSLELMKLIAEAAAEGSFVDFIQRFHWLDIELPAAILCSDYIVDPQLRLNLAIHSLCEDQKGQD